MEKNTQQLVDHYASKLDIEAMLELRDELRTNMHRIIDQPKNPTNDRMLAALARSFALVQWHADQLEERIRTMAIDRTRGRVFRLVNPK